MATEICEKKLFSRSQEALKIGKDLKFLIQQDPFGPSTSITKILSCVQEQIRSNHAKFTVCKQQQEFNAIAMCSRQRDDDDEERISQRQIKGNSRSPARVSDCQY
jgi:hypothetical protein